LQSLDESDLLSGPGFGFFKHACSRIASDHYYTIIVTQDQITGSDRHVPHCYRFI
jgi:hypothetical protein